MSGHWFGNFHQSFANHTHCCMAEQDQENWISHPQFPFVFDHIKPGFSADIWSLIDISMVKYSLSYNKLILPPFHTIAVIQIWYSAPIEYLSQKTTHHSPRTVWIQFTDPPTRLFELIMSTHHNGWGLRYISIYRCHLDSVGVSEWVMKFYSLSRTSMSMYKPRNYNQHIGIITFPPGRYYTFLDQCFNNFALYSHHSSQTPW